MNKSLAFAISFTGKMKPGSSLYLHEFDILKNTMAILQLFCVASIGKVKGINSIIGYIFQSWELSR